MDKVTKTIDNHAAESLLESIREIAEETLADASADEDVRAKQYADVAERIRDLVRRDWLDMGDFRLVRFHAGEVTTFVGTDKTAGRLVEVRVHGDGISNYMAVFTENGIRIATMDFSHAGLHRCERMAVGALHGLFGYRMHNNH